VLRINKRMIRSSDREPKWDHEVGANIGLEGLGILSEKRLPPCTDVRVEFLLPGECTEDTELLQADGRIRWSRPCAIRGKKLHFMDLEFTRLSPKAKAQIQRFLDEPR